MEANQAEHWKLFHREKDSKHRVNFIVGAISAPAMVAAPIIFLWLMVKIYG